MQATQDKKQRILVSGLRDIGLQFIHGIHHIAANVEKLYLHDPTPLSYYDMYTFPGMHDEDIGITTRAQKAKEVLLKEWTEEQIQIVTSLTELDINLICITEVFTTIDDVFSQCASYTSRGCIAGIAFGLGPLGVICAVPHSLG